jgi:hypothetical protein
MGITGRGLCSACYRQWRLAGKPALPRWLRQGTTGLKASDSGYRAAP